MAKRSLRKIEQMIARLGGGSTDPQIVVVRPDPEEGVSIPTPKPPKRKRKAVLSVTVKPAREEKPEELPAVWRDIYAGDDEIERLLDPMYRAINNLGTVNLRIHYTGSYPNIGKIVELPASKPPSRFVTMDPGRRVGGQL